MPLPLAIFLPLVAQVGPSGALPQAPLDMHRPQAARTAQAEQTPPRNSRIAQCLALAQANPASAIETAQKWRGVVTGAAKAAPEHCLGVALSGLGRWEEAEAALRTARDDTPASDPESRARRGAMAGNAALAGGATDRALAALDLAHADAQGAGLTPLAGEIAVDRARALVMLGRTDAATAALAEARSAAPDNAQGWLLSATFSRRQGKLDEAQAQIEHAARLAPADPEVGLEAGVIAVLSGHEAAARRSWQSVIATASDSPEAKTAQGYLDQLGPDTSPSGR